MLCLTLSLLLSYANRLVQFGLSKCSLKRAAPNEIALDDIVRHLRATPFLVRRIVEQLVAEKLVALAHDQSARFHPDSVEQEKLCDMLEVASSERPIALRDAIVAAPTDKLRNFIDAFRLKDKDR